MTTSTKLLNTSDTRQMNHTVRRIIQLPRRCWHGLKAPSETNKLVVLKSILYMSIFGLFQSSLANTQNTNSVKGCLPGEGEQCIIIEIRSPSSPPRITQEVQTLNGQSKIASDEKKKKLCIWWYQRHVCILFWLTFLVFFFLISQ